jgi:hypothetical protein
VAIDLPSAAKCDDSWLGEQVVAIVAGAVGVVCRRRCVIELSREVRPMRTDGRVVVGEWPALDSRRSVHIGSRNS